MAKRRDEMASPAGVEPATYALGGRCAIQLCHGDLKPHSTKTCSERSPPAHLIDSKPAAERGQDRTERRCPGGAMTLPIITAHLAQRHHTRRLIGPPLDRRIEGVERLFDSGFADREYENARLREALAIRVSPRG